MLDEYISRGKEKLRCGYTTGSCATAAAKAAAIMLLSGNDIEEVRISTPKGIDLVLEVLDITKEEGFVKCAIKKDSGDDPDITKGILVYAKVSIIEAVDRVVIEGGEGIGTVTKKGLDQPVGNAAINKTPRRMIKEHLLEVMEEQEYTGSLLVTISIPGGKEIAKKTFNPKLGIEGGLSIIGTTGIVEPMSSQALIETIRIEENMLRECNRKNILVTLGNYGKTFLKQEMPEVLEKSVTCSNFIGEALEIALEYDFEGVLLVGHIGKMVKLGAGIMNTHSSNADGRMEVLITCGVLAGIAGEVLMQLAECVTVDDAVAILRKEPQYEKMIDILMERIHYYLQNKVKEEIKVGAIIFSNVYGIIGKTSYADEIKNKILEEENG